MEVVRFPEPIGTPAARAMCLDSSAPPDAERDLESALQVALRDLAPTMFVSRAQSNATQAETAWLLDAFERSAVIAIWIDSVEPPTDTLLMEIGLAVQSGKLIVGCPRGVSIPAVIDVVIKRHNIPVVESVVSLAALARERLA